MTWRIGSLIGHDQPSSSGNDRWLNSHRTRKNSSIPSSRMGSTNNSPQSRPVWLVVGIPICEPWCWYIYLQNWLILDKGKCWCAYSSTMDHLGYLPLWKMMDWVRQLRWWWHSQLNSSSHSKFHGSRWFQMVPVTTKQWLLTINHH